MSSSSGSERRSTALGAGRRRGGRHAGFVLRIVEGPNSGREFGFENEARIGRVEGNEVVLIEPGISRWHSRIYEERGVYLLEDLGSANGTRLNGEKISGTEVLREGDHITLSYTTFLFSGLEAKRGDPTKQIRLSESDIAPSRDASRIGGMRRWSRHWKSLTIAGVALAAILAYAALKGGKGTSHLFDQSDVPVVYSDDDDFLGRVLGYGNYDRKHRDQVIIVFDYIGGRATLRYGAWGIDRPGEVVIELNGQEIGEVPSTMDRTLYGLTRVLPAARLKKGQPNRLVFNNKRNPPDDDTWEVSYLQILQEALPPPDANEARRRFELALKAWEDRHVAPGNMAGALEGFREARDLLEKLPRKPELYGEAKEMIERVDQELTRRFQEGLFTAQRALKVHGDTRAARGALVQTFRFFRKDDFRYRALKRYIDALSKP